MPFAETWMDLEIVIPSEASQTEYHMISVTCGVPPNYTDELTYKIEINPQTQKTNL